MILNEDYQKVSQCRNNNWLSYSYPLSCMNIIQNLMFHHLNIMSYKPFLLGLGIGICTAIEANNFPT